MPRGAGGRKHWEQGDTAQPFPTEEDVRAKEEVSPAYEEYLLLLQERNRLMKKLKAKDSKQIELERKEQGFSLYLNGANTNLHPNREVQPQTARPKSRKTKTAGERQPGSKITHKDLEDLVKDKQEDDNRSKTAPEKSRRKNWAAGSVEVKTARGEKVKVKAPDILTGQYEDDFELASFNDDEGGDEREVSQNFERLMDMEDLEDGEIEVDASKIGNSRRNESEKEEPNEQLMLSIADVKKLRASLEMNSSIQQSILEDIDTGSSGSDREPTIPEETEPETPGRSVNNSLQPTDIIVLELAPSPSREKKERVLSAKRKDTTDSLGPHADSSRSSQPSAAQCRSPRNSDIMMKAGTPSRRSNPLSANRKSKKCDDLDTSVEAKAVMAALQAENEQADGFTRDSHSAPGRHQRNSKSPIPKVDSSVSRPISSSTTKKEKLRVSGGDPSRPPDVICTEAHDVGTNVSRDKWTSPPGGLHPRDIQGIVNKVLQLNTRQQKKLLQALTEIEESTSNTTSPRSTNTSPSPTKYKSPPQKTPITHMVKSPSSNSVSDQGTLRVKIQLCSNWGHSSRIGLTEIQFLDSQRRKLEVDQADVIVHGAGRSKTDVANLFNGKYKTVKERYMWSCDFDPARGVEFIIPVQAPETEDSTISSVKMWNYNKNLQDLCIGARHIKVMIGHCVVFEGELDKGCGNQIFDYSKCISLDGQDDDSRGNKTPGVDNVLFHSSDEEGSPSDRADSAAPPRCETRAMSRNEDLDLPVISPPRKSSSDEKSLGKTEVAKPASSVGEPRQRRRERHRERRSKKMAAKLDGNGVAKSAQSVGSLSYNSDASLSVEWTKSLDTSAGHNQLPKLTQREVKGSTEVTGPAVPSDPAHVDTKLLPAKEEPAQPSAEYEACTAPASEHSQIPADTETVPQAREVTRVKQWSITEKCGSPAVSDDESSMLSRLQEINQENLTESHKKEKGVPSWLKGQAAPEPFENPPESRSGNRPEVQEENLLEHWPKAGKDYLSTVLDSDASRAESPSFGRRAKAPSPIPRLPLNTQTDSSEETEKGRMTPMQQIESARSKRRQMQQDKLEESWTSLSLFDRLQKGRISMDINNDLLDEYLGGDKKKQVETTPVEPKQKEQPEEFVIPELPSGSHVVVNIRSTWGDKHYVGLNGIELFSSTGTPPRVKSIKAEPSDINILDEYNKDPRVVSNLVDGINRTRDDTHMWLAPFTKGREHKVMMTLDKPCQLAMMRIWNYNKSRIHSFRGARDIDVTFDGRMIFSGEIARACGGEVGGSESFGDTILFTMDESILEQVSLHDQAFEGDLLDDDFMDEEAGERPKTADDGAGPRPHTTASRPQKTDVPEPASAVEETEASPDVVLNGRCLKLDFRSTWGDPYYLGLTGLEVVGQDGEALPVSLDMMEADPRDLHVLPGYETDDRTLDKLLDGTNITTSDEHMWLVPFTDGESHLLQFNFTTPTEMVGLRIWNYNKSAEDTYRGAKTVHVYLDDRRVSPPSGYLIRKGPGNCFFDFAQEIMFSEAQAVNPGRGKQTTQEIRKSMQGEEPSQDYESVQMPCGFIYQLQLLSTWGDPYYVGLNGIEFYDGQGNKIPLTQNNISAYPDSVNVLEGVSNDVRTPDKLIDGIFDTTDGTHMWLAPILPTLMNRVYVIFDQPMEVSLIKLWNYSKTSNRGVKDFALLVDDLLVYNGTLDVVSGAARGILPTCSGPQRYHTILFTQDKAILQREKHTIIKNQAGEQDVQLLNDRQIVSHYSDPKKAQSRPVDQARRPTTSVTGRNMRR